MIADLLAQTWGFALCVLYLYSVKGHVWNPKRVHRICCALALNLRIMPRRRLRRENPEDLGIEVYFSLPADRVARSFNQIIEWRGKPRENACVARYNRTLRHERPDL